MKNSETSALKLNYRRTALIGFAFFGILLLWQVYDSWCPTFLTDIFARSIYDLSSAELKASAPEKLLHVQWIVGIIMACDNLAALILLPIFGNLSDRISEMVSYISDSMEQVNAAVASIAESATETATNSSEVTDTMDEVAGIVETVSDMAGEQLEVSENLDSIVRQFKL